MAITAKDFTTHFASRVAELRDSHGDTVAIGDIADVVASLMTTMEVDLSAIEIQVHREIRGLVEYIEAAKSEIAALDPREIQDTDIPTAINELDAVVNATEAATNSILDAAEKLGELAAELEPAKAEVVGDITTRIYEASNFQDITGQRITKVVATLLHIEAKLVALSKALGEDVGPAPPKGAAETPIAKDMALLHGPSLPQDANSQEDIDALLASFD